VTDSPRVYVGCGTLPTREVLALAPAIEQYGYDGLALPDHLFMPHTQPGEYPYSEDGQPPFPLDTPWPDVFVLTAAIAALTSTMRVLTSVYVLPMRHPLNVAKAAGTAALISNGRLSLGIGLGWQREEFAAVGVDFSKRGALTDEMIVAMRALWRKGPVEHHGRFFSFGPLLMEPVPPRIPIIIGGTSDAAFRRAARLGDGYLLPVMPPQDVPPYVERLRAELVSAGREGDDFETIIPTFVSSGEELEPVLALNIDTIVVLPWLAAGAEPITTEQKIGHLERFAAEVLAPLRSGSTAVTRSQ
jgi:probable F420-dependent oxidoreductase